MTSLRLCPALKPLPDPSRIITFIFLSLSSFLKTLIKSFKFLNDNELYVLGSLIVIIDIPPDKFLTFNIH